MQASQKFCKLANCFTHSLERLSPFYLKVPQHCCFCPLLLASHTLNLHCSVFKVQPSNLFQGQIETLKAWMLQSNLAYSLWKLSLLTFFLERKWVVGPSGLEPPTSRLSVARSSQLSYGPVWWRLPDSNRWPPACKAGALPAELNPHGGVYPLN